ncbi:MAG: hypothetical protein Q9227_001628 [Pyrenula ochraceoflavens]
MDGDDVAICESNVSVLTTASSQNDCLDTQTMGAFVPRAYQIEMFEASMKQNVIVTVRHHSIPNGKSSKCTDPQRDGHWERQNDGLCWLTTPTVPLAQQQFQVIKAQLPAYQSRLISGADKPELWKDQEVWDALLSNIRIVVSTPAVLSDALTHGFVNISRISLLVFDEAHHVHAKAPLNRMMNTFYHPKHQADLASDLPHILGLTASPIAGNKVKALEDLEKNLNATCKSPMRHFEDLKRFVHLPKLEYVQFMQQEMANSDGLQALIAIVNDANDNIQEDPYVKSLLKSGNPKRLEKAQQFLAGEKKTESQRFLSSILRRIEELQNEIGVWGAEYYLSMCAKKCVEAAKRPMMIPPSIEDQERQYLADRMATLATRRLPETNFERDGQVAQKTASLLQLLAKYHDESVNAITFLQTRCKVAVLAKLIAVHPLTAGLYNASPLVGSSSYASYKADPLELVEASVQVEALENFRTGKTNLIVATSVVEEGIDVQATNLVIRFDEPQNLRSYIQSRGRARKQDSRFVIFLSGSKPVVSKWEALEQQMREAYLEEWRRIEKQGVIEDEEVGDRKYHVETTGAVLTLDNATPHLHHFCNKLSKVPYAEDPRPEYIISGERGESVETRVILPNSIDPSIRETWSSRPYRSERLSKQDASLEACIKLHAAGLLNDHLLPEPPTKNVSQRRSRREGHINIRPRLDPWFCDAEDAQVQWTPHILSIAAPGLRIPNMLFFCKGRIASMLTFPLYWSSNVLMLATIQPSNESSRPRLIHAEALAVTQLLFQSMYRHKLFALKSRWNMLEYPYLFIPESEQHDLPSWLQDVTGTVAATKINFRNNGMCEIIRDGQVVERSQGVLRQKESIQTRRPYKLRRCLHKPRDRGAESANSDDVHMQEELHLELSKMPRRIDYVHFENIGAEAAESSCVPAEELVMDLLPLPYSSFMLYVPSMLHYVETALVAQKLSDTVLAPLCLKNTKLLVDAVTAPSSNRIKNYERLEFLGDSLLKYWVSLQLFSDHPLWPEGYLTEEKSWLVSNKCLCKAAMRNGLDPYITTASFAGARWSPTVIPNHPQVPTGDVENRQVSSKLLADVVEALIAVAYMDGAYDPESKDRGLLSCLMLFFPEIVWKGTAENTVIAKSRVPPSEPYEFPEHVRLSKILFGFHFNEIRLLLEALTHNSATSVRELSYQRLEFLGDAVLDHLLTVPLMDYKCAHYPRGLPESIMTLLKHALVNADLLAYFCLGFSFTESIALPVVDSINEKATTEQTTVQRYLWQYIRHSGSSDFVEDQNRTLETYMQLKATIQEKIISARRVPWTLLAQLRAKKSYSDIIESIIGAIFIDSGGKLEAVKTFVSKMGLWAYMESLLASIRQHGVFDPNDNVTGVETMHPKMRLGIVAAKDKRTVKYKIEEMREGKGFNGSVMVAGQVVGAVEGAHSISEAETTVAHLGLEVLLPTENWPRD